MRAVKQILLIFTTLSSLLCIFVLRFVYDTNATAQLSYDQPSSGTVAGPWQNLVEETQRHLRLTSADKQPDRLKVADEFITQLNLKEPKRHNVSNATKVKPLVVIPLFANSATLFDETLRLVSDVRWILSDLQVWLYDIHGTLTDRQRQTIARACRNSSCEVKHIDPTTLPTHIASPTYHAYRPLLLASALNSSVSPVVLYLQPPHADFRLAPGAETVLASLMSVVWKEGVAGFPLDDSTSTFTHPRLFTALAANADAYRFHRAMAGNAVAMKADERAHNQVLLPWLRCALTRDCIDPIGAQGCPLPVNYRRPRYLYAGCHLYDTSAMNVVLGAVFDHVADSYQLPSNLKLFVPTSPVLRDTDVTLLS